LQQFNSQNQTVNLKNVGAIPATPQNKAENSSLATEEVRDISPRGRRISKQRLAGT
jgi:hypothetical protein